MTHTPAGHRGKCRRIGLLAGLLAFFVHVMAWGMHVPPSSGFAGGLMPICTAQGVKFVALDAGNAGTMPDDAGRTVPASTSGGFCPFCVLTGGLSVPPPAVVVAPPSVALLDRTLIPLAGDVIAAGWYLSRLQARAPPAFG